MTDIVWPDADGSGITAAPTGFMFGANTNGFRRHLVEPEDYSRTALCGVVVSGMTEGALLRPHGRSYACPKCVKIANVAGPQGEG